METTTKSSRSIGKTLAALGLAAGLVVASTTPASATHCLFPGVCFGDGIKLCDTCGRM